MIDNLLVFLRSLKVENKYLYHYTNLQSLAMILKSQSIRFSPLTLLDDLQEEQSIDERSYGKYVFVSSWTFDHKENIALWKMYTDMSSGIRIKLRNNPFEYTKIINESLGESETLSKNWIKLNREGKFKIIHIFEQFNNEYLYMPLTNEELQIDIEYVEEKEKLLPKLEEFDLDSFKLHLGKLGKFKNIYWAFQKESRFKISVIPLEIIDNEFQGIRDGSFNFFGKILREENLPFEYLYLTICLDAFNEMEITLSPLMTQANRIMLESLVNQYNRNIKIVESELKGLLRK